MKTATFYAIATVASVSAIVAEALYSRRAKKGWYEAKDVATNLNIGAGNMLSGLVLALVVAAGYAFLLSHRVWDASSKLPGWASFVLAVVFADFLQYWNHRLSHRVNLLWAGHVTHHSSSHLNLSTGIRINWLYRSYAWLLYAPMPLLGFSFESFVAAQAVIGTYNLFMHTRLAVPFGPLEYLLVSPASHRLHHSAEPRHFGNYGAALIVWDRWFGTYRELLEGEAAPSYGIGRTLGTNPIRLNFHYLVDVVGVARRERRSLLRLLFGTTDGVASSLPPEAAPKEVPATLAVVWPGLVLVTLVTLVVQALVSTEPTRPANLLVIAGGLALITVFGVVLEDGSRNDGAVQDSKPTRLRRGGRVTMVVIAALVIGGALFATRFRGTAVTVAPVVRGKAVEAVYASGTVEAENRVLLRAKAGGSIELLVREGTPVRKGELLARVSNRADVSEVHSPIDGLVLGKHAASGDTVTASQPLLDVGDVNRFELVVHVDEADIVRIADGRKGAPASEVVVRLYAIPGKAFRGKVTEIYPDADRARRAYVTKVHFEEPPPDLRSGMTAEVNIIASKNDSALLVPASAERGGSVWLESNGLARPRAVVVGIRDLSTVEIKSGLSEGDRVVLDPPADLRDGTRLR